MNGVAIIPALLLAVKEKKKEQNHPLNFVSYYEACNSESVREIELNGTKDKFMNSTRFASSESYIRRFK